MQNSIAAVLMLLAGSGLSSAQQQTQAMMNRERARPAYTRGLELMKGEAWPEAAQAFKEATDIDPEFDLAYYCLGRVDMNLKKYVDAIAAYEKSRAIIRSEAGRQFSSQQERLRSTRERLVELDDAIRQLQGGALTGQNSERLRQLQEYRRQLVERTERGTTNLTVDTSVPAFLSLALGSAYFRAERFDDAEREYKAAIDADPKAGEAHSNLAALYLQIGRVDEAEKSVKSAEKVGFRVNPGLKDAIQAAKKKTM
jgi:tetratricopeptide (TPR) repeat protein